MYVAMDGSMMVAIHNLVSKYVLSGYLEPFGYSGSCPRNQGAVNVFAAAVWWCYSPLAGAVGWSCVGGRDRQQKVILWQPARMLSGVADVRERPIDINCQTIEKEGAK